MNSKPRMSFTSLDASEWKCLKEGSVAREKRWSFSMAFANLRREQTQTERQEPARVCPPPPPRPSRAATSCG